MTPRNGQSLLDLRMRGLVPELPVLVSLVGTLDFSNVTLYADAGKPYDWRVIAGLEVEVFASLAVPFSGLLRTLADIAAAVPKRMVLAFSEGARIECGEMRLVRDENGDFGLFDWFPIAVGPYDAHGAKVAKRLWAELGKSIPIPFDEAMTLVHQIAAEKQCA
jgi:hypothetical protein